MLRALGGTVVAMVAAVGVGTLLGMIFDQSFRASVVRAIKKWSS